MVAGANFRPSGKDLIQDFTRNDLCHHQKGQVREQGQPLQALQTPVATSSQTCRKESDNTRDRVSIHRRPAEAAGKRFGDFEKDTIAGRNNRGAILTMVERSTNMLFMKKLKHGKDAEEPAQAAILLLAPYKGQIKTITTDNGTEFCNHKVIASELNTIVYFTDPYSSWQEGAIENANGLIRQYIPKSSPIKQLKDRDIDDIIAKINSRPRKKLNYSTPVEEFFCYIGVNLHLLVEFAFRKNG